MDRPEIWILESVGLDSGRISYLVSKMPGSDWVTALAAKPNYLSSMPRTHTVKGSN